MELRRSVQRAGGGGENQSPEAGLGSAGPGDAGNEWRGSGFRAEKSNTRSPIVLFTMYDENIGKYLTSAIGVDAVLSKPDGVTALAKAVDAVLTRKPS